MLLLDAAPGSGQRWTYAYSVAPGVVVRLVVMPGPGMPPPTDPVFAQIVLALVDQPA